ncbi:MAG: hypothetical protein ACREUU_03215, partial [Gammaproteobacteria bacterium]
VMSKLVLSLLVVAAVVLSGTGMLWAAEDTVSHQGTISKVDKEALTIKSDDAQTVVSLAPTTKFTLDGKAAKAEDLKPGMKVKTSCKKEGAKFIAISVDATSA